MNLNTATLAAVVGELAGIAGVILTAVGAGSMATPVRAVLMAVAGALVTVTHHHTTKATVAKAAAKGSGGGGASGQ